MNMSLPLLPWSIHSEPLSARCEVVPLTPGREHDWDRFVLDHSGGTVFHTLNWRNAVHHAFKHEAEYMIAIRDGRITGVLPMFLIERPFLGRMLVSVPYAVGGGILANNEQTASALFENACERAALLRSSMIDFRSECAQVPQLPITRSHVGFERELPATPDQVLEWLPRKARAVVRNARTKFGLTCEFGQEHLHTLWLLYCRNMRRLGSINYPLRFFQQLAAGFRSRCWCTVVKSGGEPIAGLLTLIFRDRVLPYFFGCKVSARDCGAANLIYASTMERAVSEGYRIFDFGRSRRDNKGSLDFKRFHGFEPRPLAYQRYMVESSKPVELTPTNPSFSLARRIWPHLPLAITRPAGAFLSQYIPG